VVGEVWATWSHDMAAVFALDAYPSLLVSTETIQQTDDYLQRADPPAGLRRLLLEGRAGVERALTAQACDRAAARRGD
jgi:aminopeptidase N